MKDQNETEFGFLRTENMTVRAGSTWFRSDYGSIFLLSSAIGFLGTPSVVYDLEPDPKVELKLYL